MLEHLNDSSCPLPKPGVVSNLVLQKHFIADLKCWYFGDMFGPFFMAELVAVSHCFFSVIH